MNYCEECDMLEPETHEEDGECVCECGALIRFLDEDAGKDR